MAEYMAMPRMSDTMTVGTLVTWHKKVGDTVKSGDILADVQTDKATMELESYYDGEILYQAVKEGEEIPVDALLIIIGKKGEDIQPILQQFQTKTSNTEQQTAASPQTQELAISSTSAVPVSQTVSSHEQSDSRLKASPLAKKLAQENQINLQEVKGSGDNGRIVKKDIENYLSHQSTQVQIPLSTQQSPTTSHPYQDVPLNNFRKVIAQRLTESKNSAPHFYLTMKIFMDNAITFRKQLNELTETKISFNDIIIKAVATALKKHPQVNASWMGDKIRYHQAVNIGVAVAIDEGLVVPVLKNADGKGIQQIAEEVKGYVQKAKGKGLHPDDFTGNTFTISNLGMFGIEEFTAIINPPDACILAVGAIQEEPIVKNQQIVIGNTLRVTLSCDHRVVDGAVGSAFLQTLKALLEDPIKMLL